MLALLYHPENAHASIAARKRPCSREFTELTRAMRTQVSNVSMTAT